MRTALTSPGRLVVAGPTLLLLLALLGCGGGGGGGGADGLPAPPADLLSDAYGFTSWAARADSGGSHTSRWGTWVSDGTEACAASYSWNQDTHVGTGGSDYTYVLGGGRSVVLSALGHAFAYGGIASQGDLLALANTAPGVAPGILLIVRPASPASDPDLVGVYRGCGLEHNGPLNKAQATVGSYTFDGSGSYTTTRRLNVGGLVSPSGTSGPWDYAVGDTGTVAFQTAPSATTGGVLHTSGDLLVVAGSREDGEPSCLHVFVRRGSGFTTASLNGGYELVGLHFDVDLLGWTCIEGSLSADGLGGWSATVTRNLETETSGPHTLSGTYVLTDSGGLTITASDGQVYEGGLSPDGRLAIFGGGVSDLSDPALFVLLR